MPVMRRKPFADRAFRASCLALLCASVTGLVAPVVAQSLSDMERRGALGLGAATRGTDRPLPGNRSARSGDRIALERAVDPATYYLAPGDLLTVSIWGATDLMMELPVGADGNLIVPSVGVLPVGGTTLVAANETLREACRGPYPRSEVSLTLAQPALLRIPVTGLVADPGSWEVLSTSRVSDVLQMAGGFRENADSRQVEIRRGGDAVLRCDLLAYLADGAADENPMLRSGDRVYVPPAENVVRVRGILSSAPGEQIRPSSPLDRPFEPQTRLIPLRGEDHLDFVIRAAGGPGRAFCDEGVWVQRADTTAVWVERAGWPRFAMSPGDVVDVPFCGEWVAVVGEVVRPGLYPFLPGETVADYVFAAGGPSTSGRGSGWSIVERSGEERSAAPGDTVAAGMRIRVPRRRMHSVNEFIAPVASLLALTISLVALFR